MKRIALIIAGAAVFTTVALFLELSFVRIEAGSTTGRVIFLLLLNLNVLALLGLVFYVGKALFKLFTERRQRALGYKFKTKVVASFFILTAIPASLLFLFASGLGTNYIDRLFTPQFREPIESSIEVAKKLYDMERKRTLMYAKMARSGFKPPTYYRVIYMDTMPEDASASIKAAFSGESATEVISGQDSDTVRAALPFNSAAPEAGIIVVESSIPPDITKNIERIRTAYEDYIKLEAWSLPLKLNYLLMLGFFTLIIIFASLWFSLRIAGWITEPVRKLAMATEAVASGNLSVSVTSTRHDEMGLLIESFNRMVREIREGKESLQKAYLESDRRRLTIENILENIQSGVISLDAKGNVVTINSAACNILDLKAEDVLGKYYTEMLSGINSAELQELIKSINIRTLKAVNKEVRATLGGRKVLLRVSITGLRSSSGEYLGLLVVVDDLTGVMKAQRALAWQEVARRMAHEIKNPLTPIKLSTERMLKKWQSGDAEFDQIFERSTKTIIREVDGLKRLVDEFSRLGKMPEITKTPTDIRAVIDDVVNLYRDYKELNIKVDSPEDMPPVELDGEQFKRVMINLFDNALEAMGNKGSIEVRISPDNERNKVSIDIADNGPGIKDEDKERLFLPYFSTKKHGTGLGLAIADKIIAEHGGHIRVRDNTPCGSVFTIELPIKEE